MALCFRARTMFRGIHCLFLVTYFGVVVSDVQDNSIDDAPYNRQISYSPVAGSISSQNIWVLQLNDGGLETLKIRGANEEEKEDFDFYTQPLVENYNREHNVVKKDNPKPKKAESIDKKKSVLMKPVTKEDIFKYLNKFAMYSKTESDAYLSDSHENDDPSIALYFKGPFASLIVKQGIRQWHYFIPPPSLLPAWFSESHEQDPTEVPPAVADKFYPALYRLLQALLRYPV